MRTHLETPPDTNIVYLSPAANLFCFLQHAFYMMIVTFSVQIIRFS